MRLIGFGVNFQLTRFSKVKRQRGAHAPFRNHSGRMAETGRSPSAPNEPAATGKNPVDIRSLAAGRTTLAFA
jgi:hypothetical protein